MNPWTLLLPCLLFLVADVLRAEPPRPNADKNAPGRQAEAVRAVRLALEDLPPGKEADQIKEAIEKLRKQLADDLQARIKKAEADLEAVRDRVTWAQRLVKAGFLAPIDVLTARQKVEDAEHALRQLQDKAKLLTDDALKDALAKHQKERAAEVRDRMKLVEADIALWQDRAAWSDRMVKKGYLTSNQAKSDRIRLERAENALHDLQAELKLLTAEPKKDK